MAQMFQDGKQEIDVPSAPVTLPVEPGGSHAPVCPECGSGHLVMESADRYLCLYCHSVSAADGDGLRVHHRLCAHCGAENESRAGTCHACGLSLQARCLKCDQRIAVWQTTCPRCGTDQEAYREELAAQERERQRQLAEIRSSQRQRQSPARPYRPHRRRRRWPGGWLMWPLMWWLVFGGAGRWLRGAFGAVSTGGTGLAPSVQLAGQSPAVLVGVCVFSAGVLVFAAAALPGLLRRH